MRRNIYRIANLLAAAGLVACGLLAMQIDASNAQVVPAIDHDPSKIDDLKAYYRDRLVEIVVTGNRVSDAQPIDPVYGVGFLISSLGEVVTAKHVIELTQQPQDYAVSVQVYSHDAQHHHTDAMQGAVGSYRVSNLSDIGLFKINSDGAIPFKYMCVDKSFPKLGPRDTLTIATSTNLTGNLSQFQFQFAPGRHIEHPEGPGDMYKYLGVDFHFVASNSGGAVVRDSDDKVIGVISANLKQGGSEIPDQSYADLLYDASDIGIQPDPNCERGAEPLPLPSQKEFMSNTCEGTIGWMRDRAGGAYWIFPQSGEYHVNRKDMPDCPGGNEGDKSLHLAVNHSTAGKCHRGRNACSFGAGLATYYGVQLVPVIEEGEGGTVLTQTWLYKSAVLFARRPDGSFYTPADRAMPTPIKTDGSSPSDFDEAIHDAVSGISNREANSCTKKIDANACSDLLAISKFEEGLGTERPWQGYPRKDNAAESTLETGGKLIWRVPSDWLNAGKKQVKNWILRYRGTNEVQSPSPVDFSFCISPQWKEFYLRVFSPERCQEPELIHVFVSD